MSDSNTRDVIDIEVWRVLIQNHPSYAEWYASLGLSGRSIVDGLLEEDVSPEQILMSQEAPEEEQDAFQFLSILAGGNPNPNMALALTNFVLLDILNELRDFGNPET